jgi:hypothetical protein
MEVVLIANIATGITNRNTRCQQLIFAGNNKSVLPIIAGVY